jgi:hypothetical protein
MRIVSFLLVLFTLPAVFAADFSVKVADEPLPQKQDFGRLRLLHSWLLSAELSDFGGFSSLHVHVQGKALRLLSISDKGDVFAGVLHDWQQASGARLESASLQPLASLMKPSLRDAEGLQVRADGSLLLSFERQHRLMTYASLDARYGQHLPFPDMIIQQLGGNTGIEGLVETADGTVYLFSEGDAASRSPIPAWVRSANGKHYVRFFTQREAEYRITDALLYDSSHIWLLQRAVRGLGFFRGRIVAIPLPPNPLDLEDSILQPELIAELPESFAWDNIEGISRFHYDGKQYLMLISDDNFSRMMQRTRLHLFEISK